MEGQGSDQGLVFLVFPVCPVYEGGEGMVFGETPEPVESALSLGGEGCLAGEVGADGFSEGSEGRVDPRGDNLEEGSWGLHNIQLPFLLSFVKPRL